MSILSFDVSLGDKTLTWQGQGAATPPRPAPPWPVPPRPAPAAGCATQRAPKPAEPEPEPVRAGVARSCTPHSSLECQASTLAALAALAVVHLFLLQNATSLVVSAYVLVIGPLLGTFYHLPPGGALHLYALNLAAVFVLLANVRFERDISAAFFAVAAAVFLHVLAGAAQARAAAAAPPLPGAAPAAQPLPGAPQALVSAAAPAALNVLAAYYFFVHADVAYNPRLHGLQALVLALDALTYTWLRAHLLRPGALRAAAARSYA